MCSQCDTEVAECQKGRDKMERLVTCRDYTVSDILQRLTVSDILQRLY